MEQTFSEVLDQLQKVLAGKNEVVIQETATKFQNSVHQPALSYLLKAVDNGRLEDAATLLKDLLRQQQQLAVYYDPKIGALKVELKYQENELGKYVVVMEELSKKINLFQAQYFSQVGYLIERVLYLRKEKLRIQAIGNPALEELLARAEQEYNDFFDFKEQAKDGVIYQLSDEKLKEIKRLYRKASMICHPDRVREDQRAKAETVFDELNKAYKQNDLKKVRSIATFLNKMGHFDMKIDAYDNVEVVRAQIEHILLQIEETEEEIETIKGSSAYHTVESIDGEWKVYFATIRDNFKAQIENIEGWMVANKENIAKDK